MGCSLSALFWTHNYFTSVTSLSPSPALHCHTHTHIDPTQPPCLLSLKERKRVCACVFVCVWLSLDLRVGRFPAKTSIAATRQPLLCVLVSVVTNQNHSLVAVCLCGGFWLSNWIPKIIFWQDVVQLETVVLRSALKGNLGGTWAAWQFFLNKIWSAKKRAHKWRMIWNKNCQNSKSEGYISVTVI